MKWLVTGTLVLQLGCQGSTGTITLSLDPAAPRAQSMLDTIDGDAVFTNNARRPIEVKVGAIVPAVNLVGLLARTDPIDAAREVAAGRRTLGPYPFFVPSDELLQLAPNESYSVSLRDLRWNSMIYDATGTKSDEGQWYLRLVLMASKREGLPRRPLISRCYKLTVLPHVAEERGRLVVNRD